MTAPVRPVRFDSDERELINVLQRNLPYRSHARFFRWLYRNNPDGEAMAWVATDRDTTRIVGAAAAFPRRISAGGRTASGFVLGDFCIDPAYRSLGLALVLQRACLDGLSSPEPSFVFDFPSQSMLAIYKRLRIEVNTSMIRHSKLLRADRKIAEHTRVRAVAAGLSTVVNAGLRLRAGRIKPAPDWTIATEAGPWGEEFTRAAMEWSPSTGFCVFRSANYLNWRYREHPTQNYEMLAARQGDKLCGYLIYHINGEDGIIDDLSAEDNRVRCALLAEATAVAVRQGIHTLSAPWLATHSGRHLLDQCGFRPRESRPVVVLALPQSTQPLVEPIKDDWCFTNGDWEA